MNARERRRSETLNLDWLVTASGIGRFFQNYSAKKPFLLGRKDKSFYERLFNLENMDELLTEGNGTLTFPKIVVKSDGIPIPKEIYCYSRATMGTVAWIVDSQKVIDLHRKGATIIFNGLEQSWGPVDSLCRNLEKELGLPVGANIYLSPPKGQSGKLHFDDHDVLCLQLKGSKIWRCYEPQLALPLSPQANRQVCKTKLLDEFKFEQGDLYFLPRGILHETETANDFSMHLTLSIQTASRCWFHVLQEGLKRLAETDSRFRETVPDDPSHRQQRFAELTKAVEHLDVEGLISEIERRFVASRRPALRHSLSAVAGAAAIGLNTLVKRKEDVLYGIYPGEYAFEIVCGGTEIRLFNAFLPLVEHLMRSETSTRVADLPGELEGDARIEIVRRLVENNLLTLCADAERKISETHGADLSPVMRGRAKGCLS